MDSIQYIKVSTVTIKSIPSDCRFVGEEISLVLYPLH